MKDQNVACFQSFSKRVQFINRLWNFMLLLLLIDIVALVAAAAALRAIGGSRLFVLLPTLC